MEDTWLRPLVWTDYRLAVLFTVIAPIILLAWAFVKRAEAIERLLIIYWRVASLLAIAVYLMIFAWPFSFWVSIGARILIPVSLWFWADINEEIREQPRSALKLVLTAWRWAATIYCGLGALFTIPFLSCAFDGAIATPACQVWLEAPRLYKQFVHPHSSTGFLGFLGFVGLIVYALYFGYFVVVRLGKQGRSALEQ
ncbi:MAG: DUF3177 family protein [Cyanophyceae cyanobacterium]